MFCLISGSALVQYLKAVFMVPRPGDRREFFGRGKGALRPRPTTPFPSGHAQSVTGLFGSAAVFLKGVGAGFVRRGNFTYGVFAHVSGRAHARRRRRGCGLGLLPWPSWCFYEGGKAHPRIFTLPARFSIARCLRMSPASGLKATDSHSRFTTARLSAGRRGLRFFHLDRKYVNFDVKARLWVQPPSLPWARACC